jgi:hypothetical protein
MRIQKIKVKKSVQSVVSVIISGSDKYQWFRQKVGRGLRSLNRSDVN